MPMMARVWRMSWVIAVAAVWCFTASPSGAIEVDLDAAAVKKAGEEGKKLKPEELRSQRPVLGLISPRTFVGEAVKFRRRRSRSTDTGR